jgi:hypothetical protein
MLTQTHNKWQFFTSHGLVLISLLNTPGKTIREIGIDLNLTDRAVARAINDLIEEGYVVKTKLGRRCFYSVNEGKPLKYPHFDDPGADFMLFLPVKSLKAENLATHAEHLEKPDQGPVRRRKSEVLPVST